MSEIGRRTLRTSLNSMACGCFSASIYTTVFNTITLTGEITEDIISGYNELSCKETLRKCGKGAVVPSVMFAMGVAFQGISRLV